ncbi:hypothetical protein FDP41_011602 [Naegleria fowleri]|uniref:Uncharacterized protein n=1 Tax=Naegleria fowleri TaxID=5763 RepID=A0A6A5C733_NAEFO|nr:uncharacterized protein FDP41_011602 [Naegleria fowleri]KAF0982672.1 hypothetical protein FDP41_011602 [Naegleria fowleri]
MSHPSPPSYDVAASSHRNSTRLSTTLTPQDLKPSAVNNMAMPPPLSQSPPYTPPSILTSGMPTAIEMVSMPVGQSVGIATSPSLSPISSGGGVPVTGPPRGSQCQIQAHPLLNRNSVAIPTSSSPPSNNRHSWQIAGDILEPLRTHSPQEDIRSHLSNRNSVHVPSPSLVEAKVRPPSYSQSKFDETSTTATQNILQASISSSDRNQSIVESDIKTDFSPPPAVTPIPNFHHHFVNSPVGTGRDAMNINNLNSEQIPDKLASSTPRKIQEKSTLSKTIWGCCGFFCICPMLCFLCFFSIIELIAIIVFQYISTHNLDPTSTSEDSSIFSMVLVAQIATFAAVIMCCVVSSLMATSAMCDNTLSKVETKNRFIVAMITLIIGLIFIMLLMLRGGLEGYTTKVLFERIMPGLSSNFMNSLTTQFNFIPSAIVVLMFFLCILTVLICGAIGFCCVCWFCCCSTNLFVKQLKRAKKQKMATP